eukprot:scaffold1247_cov170-Ochromonas_danica.AAC.2
MLADEYGALDCSGETFVQKDFHLEKGGVLQEAHVRYNTYGKLNDARDNVLVVCHALTGNSRLDLWWGGLLGPDRAFDTNKYFIICANLLGSCYGSTGPRSINPLTGQAYGADLPEITLRDGVRLNLALLQDHLGVTRVQSVIGGSMGGMQALEWLLLAPKHFVKTAVVIGCNAQHTAWQIGISEAQRQAIYADPKWQNGRFDFSDPPLTGLAVARQMAMISYRSPGSYASKFQRDYCPRAGLFEVQKYLHYQGKKFQDRFDALTYVRLTEQLDSHDICRDRAATVEEVLSTISTPVLVLGMDSDLLYPLYEQEQLARCIPGSELQVIITQHGHDGFLLEQEQVGKAVENFLAKHCL